MDSDLPVPLAARDRLRDTLREQYPDRRIIRTPWGWSASKPRTSGDIQAPTLEELATKLRGQ